MSDLIADFKTSERRSRVRFPLVQEVWYKSLGRRFDLEGGGETLNMSSSGALLATEHELNPGMRIELSICWPLKLNENAPLKLVIVGTVVRVDQQRAAVRFESHEFRILAKRRAGTETAA